jgi:hypothetical protein
MDSVIIPLDTKELLLEDAKDFLDSEEWYGQRGIPWQRGWLFYGELLRIAFTSRAMFLMGRFTGRCTRIWQGNVHIMLRVAID